MQTVTPARLPAVHLTAPRQILRDYQAKALDDMRGAFLQGHKSILLVAPTGAGKTSIAAELIHNATSRGRRVIFLAHRRELVNQCSARLDGLGVDHGIIQADHWRRRPHSLVHVASIQTLVNRTLAYPPSIIVIDECHRARAASYQHIIERYPDAVKIGLTATPVRTDGRGLGNLFTAMVQCPSVGELTAQGYLVPTRVFAPSNPDLGGVRKSGGDYTPGGLQRAMDRPTITGDIVAHWLRHGENRITVLFAAGIEHSLHLRDAFRAAGVDAEHLDGNTDTDERDRLLESLAAGRIRVLCSVGVLTEGWDCLDSETEILTPTGWKGAGDVHAGSDVISFDRRTGKLRRDTASRVVRRRLNDGEKMVSLDSQHLALRTTEGHEFHGKYRDPSKGGAHSDKWITITGRDFLERRSAFILPLTGEGLDFEGVPLSDDQIRLIAWFMTDGGFQNKNFVISQSKPWYVDEIRALLDRIGLNYKVRTRAASTGGYKANYILHEFRIPKGTHAGSLKRKGWGDLADYLDKNVSPLLWAMTAQQFNVFWSELLKGDGEKSKNKTGWLWCDRIEQVNAYTAMALQRGLSASYSPRVTKNGKTVYRVSVRTAQTLCMAPSDPRSVKVTAEESPGEMVWCVTTEASTIVARRRGKIAVIGNCPAVSCAILARPTASTGLYLQMAGRILRPAPGKSDALIFDHAGCTLAHGFVDEEREWSLDIDRPGGERVAIDTSIPVVCPQCFAVYRIRPRACGCGYVFSMPERQMPRVVDGELVEISTARERYSRIPETTRKKLYMRWVAEGVSKGYKAGYAGAKFKAMFGGSVPMEWMLEASLQHREYFAAGRREVGR